MKRLILQFLKCSGIHLSKTSCRTMAISSSHTTDTAFFYFHSNSSLGSVNHVCNLSCPAPSTEKTLSIEDILYSRLSPSHGPSSIDFPVLISLFQTFLRFCLWQTCVLRWHICSSIRSREVPEDHCTSLGGTSNKHWDLGGWEIRGQDHIEVVTETELKWSRRIGLRFWLELKLPHPLDFLLR